MKTTVVSAQNPSYNLKYSLLVWLDFQIQFW